MDRWEDVRDSDMRGGVSGGSEGWMDERMDGGGRGTCTHALDAPLKA